MTPPCCDTIPPSCPTFCNPQPRPCACGAGVPTAGLNPWLSLDFESAYVSNYACRPNDPPFLLAHTEGSTSLHNTLAHVGAGLPCRLRLQRQTFGNGSFIRCNTGQIGHDVNFPSWLVTASMGTNAGLPFWTLTVSDTTVDGSWECSSAAGCNNRSGPGYEFTAQVTPILLHGAVIGLDAVLTRHLFPPNVYPDFHETVNLSIRSGPWFDCVTDGEVPPVPPPGRTQRRRRFSLRRAKAGASLAPAGCLDCDDDGEKGEPF